MYRLDVLLGAQRQRRINVRRAVRRNQRREHRDHCHRRGCAADEKRLADVDAIKKRFAHGRQVGYAALATLSAMLSTRN